MALAHQTEIMAREKRLRPLTHYLKRQTKPDRQNAAVIDMLAAMAAKGGSVKITRITRSEE